MGRKWGYSSIWSPTEEAGPDDVEVIWENDDSGGYDWSVVAVVTRLWNGTVRQYAVYQESGCSCNIAYDFDPAGLDWQIDLSVVTNQARRAIDDAYHVSDKITQWYAMRTALELFEKRN